MQWTTEFLPPGGGFDDGFGGGMDAGLGAFGVVFTIAVVLILGAIVFSVVVTVRKYRVIKQAGHDPLAVDAELAVRALDSRLLAPGGPAGVPAGRSTEERLRDLDDLFARGVISEQERADARAAVLRD